MSSVLQDTNELANKSQVKRMHRISDMAEVESFTNNELKSKKILTRDGSKKQLLNIFRGLRTTLHKQVGDRNYACVITSVMSGCGSSYIVNNLAAAIALDELKSVLIVDCNIHDPSAQTLLTTDYQFGLTDYLSDEEMATEEIIYATGIPRVRVVPVGTNRENGAELFSNFRMHDFINEITQRYKDRFIIIDAPPAGEFAAEARILSDMADFTLLVVAFGKVTAQQVKAAAEAIAPKKLIGTIFNN